MMKICECLCAFISVGNNSQWFQCVKCVVIRSFSGPHFPAFGINFRIQSKYGKIRTKKIPNTDTSHSVCL